MKHKRFEENILIDEAYTNGYDKNADNKKSQGIAKHFADTLEYEEKKKWYNQVSEESIIPRKTLTPEQVEELRKEANSALHGDTLAYETKSAKTGSSDHQWARTLLNKGAIGDRVAAATILIQDNPVYNLTALRNMVNNVKPAKKKDGIVIIAQFLEKVLGYLHPRILTGLHIGNTLRPFQQFHTGEAKHALSELFISELLIPDAKLRTFEQHPLASLEEMTSGNKQAKRNILKLWYYEDQLKELYGSYVEALNKFAHDSVDANKEKAVSAMSYLLMHHPEREKMLLSNIINKLGDPSQAVASKVIYHLCQLLYNHPNMKSVVLIEIEKMLFRTNISPRAQYYGICFLNQFYLGKDDSKIAEDLIRIYFSFFKASIKKGDIDSRLMSAILTGVKRAYPFAERDRVALASEHVSAVHRLVHLARLGTALHALALLFHISDASDGTSDRFYTALYRKLTNAEIFNTTHSALFFSLVYKSLKKDKDVNRVASFVKRLLQLCCYMQPAQACGVLLLISQVLKDSDKKDALLLVWRREIKEEIKEETDKQDEQTAEETEENQATVDTNNANAEVDNQENLEKKKVDLLKGDKKDLLMDDDESYVDLKIDDEGNIKPKKRRATATVGWYHAKVKNEEEPEEKVEKETVTQIQMKKTLNMDRVISQYNPLARNPSYAGATSSAYLELLPLINHYHPTVKLFARKLLTDQIIHYTGDPLKDFSGIRFLDRFVFKNPKKRTDKQMNEDSNVMTVKGSHPKFAIRKNYSAKGLKGLPVNSASYLNEDEKKIPVDEKFLYDFLQTRRSESSPDDEDSDAGSVASEDFEEYLDNITSTKQDISDDELDYLAEMESNKQRRKNAEDTDEVHLGSDDDDDDDDDVNDDDDDEGSDGELNIGDDDEPTFSADEDELKLEDSDEDERIDAPRKKKAKGTMKLKLKGKDDLGSLFASAEEFSTLLEDTASNKKQGSSQAVSNTDNSSIKQLAWEDKRDTWIKGYNKKILGNKGGKFKQKGGHKMTSKRGGKRKQESAGGAGGKRKKK